MAFGESGALLMAMTPCLVLGHKVVYWPHEEKLERLRLFYHKVSMSKVVKV